MKKIKQKQSRITFEAPDDMIEWLEKYAGMNDANISWVIRRILRKEMDA